ncbi:MAG: diacylglycerol kinase family protein [Tissierellia bacterium]|nr:diacylglycerol kinase family protein [Tissierellia bacterium]
MKNPSLIKAFQYALEGVATAFKEERNLRIHSAVALIVIVAGLIAKLDPVVMAILCIVIGLVITAELFNSVIERIMDFIQIEPDPRIKAIKDISAAAVLIVAVTAAVVGIILVYAYYT